MAAPLRVFTNAHATQRLVLQIDMLRNAALGLHHLRAVSVISCVKSCRQFHTTTDQRGGFFNKMTADELWKGVTGVSNAGRKRGRAKRGQRRIDLNRGQQIGIGESGMSWPGLTNRIIMGRELVQRRALPVDPDRKKKLVELREKGGSFRVLKMPPLLRGWTGGKRYPGTSIGPPSPINDYVFEGFDTKVIEYKLVSNMTGTLGRKQRFSAFVVTGNGNGLAGYGLAKAPNGQAALRKAKNIAAQHLMYIKRYNNHTVYHDFYSKVHATGIFVKKKPEGYGLICHRAIKSMCEVMGVKDLYAKVEGRTKNYQALTKAFFAGLQKQETHQELADRMGLHVVEFRKEKDNFPQVVASPTTATLSEPITDKNFDLTRMYMDGKTPYLKPKRVPFYHRTKSWELKSDVLYKRRNQFASQIERKANY